MLSLYPDIKPYVRHTLAVEAPHQLYVEECGHPGGLPVLVLHGGPGNGCQPHQRCFFDPDLYRVILFDQRGCGRSQPHGELEKNTTTGLLADIEHIRKHLGIERWLIFGGSWGATLGLLYAEAYPNQVLGLLLRGIFLGREQDTRWFLQEGTPQIFPDVWDSLVEDIPPGEQNNLIEAFHRLLNSPDELAQMAAAKALNTWESSCSRLVSGKMPSPQAHPALLAQARLRIHYARNHYFIKPNQILNNAHQLANIPGIIIHGRYDVLCPVGNAWELHQAWPLSELQIVPVAGHAATEPAIVDALVRATNLMARRVG
ncbi:proline iminopeptidase [Nitrosococcus halophilus Nc 4]|uniref:Proline iminopeptidase n=1 Tax=Nitrosococcus halophilus (strain Nc4) TaxID=472759 RepID=D5BWC1_NITHN|nr:prolyl aminopeptidase [Nitrosococcus halophilus]ADE13771.1 proline iminopeptidase [Nitrosococcus halophilus Nc 4]